ncbi:ATP-binding cassette domain-containing protein [Desulfohalovibrio reitneri]|uniref:ATP-binding cassette domain-containing protein n=1 Tax=Desulfohalovibrio reitneri TaxID=1307759 RepID=UPI0009DD2C2A|nr:ATP-binding cassette domain-containing protein [Desulfohalovibrio reitneri]
MSIGPAHSGGYAPLRLRGVGLALHGEPLVQGLDLEVPPGEVVTLMGRSGTGKSSLLAYMTGTLPQAFRAKGSVSINGTGLDGLPPERRRLGILFQDDLLFPHMTVGQNLAFALPSSLKGGGARKARVEAALAEAGLPGFATRDPETLSGGQRARVSLLRVLLAEPLALLLDEPFSKLDVQTRTSFRAFVFDHARGLGLPTLMVTHDPDDARAAGGPVINLDE